MSDIVEKRLRNFDYADHERGCAGRCYECTCGYDDRVRERVFEAAAEIERLRAENERLRSYARQFGDALDWAHAEGFEWPSDPWAGIGDRGRSLINCAPIDSHLERGRFDATSTALQETDSGT